MTFRCNCGARATIGFGKDPSPTDPQFIPFRDYCDECFLREHPQRVERLKGAAACATEFLSQRGDK